MAGYAQQSATPAPGTEPPAATPKAVEPVAGEVDEEIVTLSPFIVDASQDQGYRATNTLAGSRINTSLKDVAASITEITPEFMKDVSATDINDILVYTAGSESTHNYTSAPQAGIGGYDDNTSTSPNSANRIRGLHSAQLMRDYFVTIGGNVGFDAYNVDRVTLNRGPNSILFGLGDPSGSVNYSPKLAQLNKDSGEATFRFGSNNDMRASVDFNQVLVDDKVAVRLAGLWSDRGFEQQPSYFKDNRIYLTGTYKPFHSTTLRVGYETVSQKQNNPNSITPIDHVTSWVDVGSPTWDPRTQLWDNRPGNFTTTAGGGTVGSTAPDGTLENTFVEGQGQQYWATWWQPNMPGVFVYSSLGVPDNRYVNLHKKNLRPTISNRDLDTLTLSWDQQIVKDLFLNVSYINEDLETSGYNWYRANQFGIFVDVNSHLPNGAVNPHFRETFMPQRSLDSKNEGNTGNQSARATLTYNLDLSKNEGWSKWLGRHTVTAFGENRTDDYWSNVYNGTRTGNPSYLNPADKINAGDWQITYLRYLGGTADTPGTNAPGAPERGAEGVPHTYWNTTTSAWAQDTWGDFYGLKRRDKGEGELSSSAFVWQGYLLKDKLVATYGRRYDKKGVISQSYTNRDPSTGVVEIDDQPFDDKPYQSGYTTTYGAVVHPLGWLSVHYNESESFQAFAGGSLNVFGESVPLPQGTGKDYGFSVDLIEGKLYAKFNWFETKATNARMPFNGPMVEVQWELPWFDQQVIPGLAARYGQTWTAANQYSPITYGDSRITETSDEQSKGIEVEVVYNPTKNWRIMANASKQEAIQTNLAPGLTRWVEEVLPIWEAAVWMDGPQTYDAGWGVNGNLRQYFNSFNTARNLATYKAFEGQKNPELREWHANVINNFEFYDGALKGWNVGGAIRWESKAAIGYPAVTDVINGVESLVGLDLAHPYEDNGNLNLDLWVGYTTNVWSDKAKLNFQLNVRDLGTSNGLQPIAKNSDGNTSTYRIEFGPTWYLSSTLSW